MNSHFSFARLLKPFAASALCSMIGLCIQPLRADEAKQPAPDAPKPAPRPRIDRMAIQKEIAAQPEGIHTISDGSICIKSGRGLAIVRSDGRGCSTGSTDNNVPAVDADCDLMAGVFFGLLANPKEGEKIGINPAQAAKIKDAYNYMDIEHTHPSPVLKLYEQYAKSAEGQAKADARKALLEKVHAVGQAYLDVEIKKLKGVKALLTRDQASQLRTLGAKMIHPVRQTGRLIERKPVDFNELRDSAPARNSNTEG